MTYPDTARELAVAADRLALNLPITIRPGTPAAAAISTAASTAANLAQHCPDVRIRIDPRDPGLVAIDDELVKIRPKAWNILLALAARPGRVLPWADVYVAITPHGEIVEPQQQYWHLAGLRKILRPHGIQIQTVPTIGIRLDLQPPEIHVTQVVTEHDVEALDQRLAALKEP